MFALSLSITAIFLAFLTAFCVFYHDYKSAKKAKNEHRKKHRLDFSPR
jgi:hypothetical protein